MKKYIVVLILAVTAFLFYRFTHKQAVTDNPASDIDVSEPNIDIPVTTDPDVPAVSEPETPVETPETPVQPDPEPDLITGYSYDIINPRFNNSGMWLTFKNNDVPKSSRLKQYIKISVFVDLIKPKTEWTGGYGSQPYTVNKLKIFKWTNPENIVLPAPGKSVDIFLSAEQLNRDDHYDPLKEMYIKKGYVDPNFSECRISKVSIEQAGGTGSGSIHHAPAFPIIVYRKLD